MEVYDLHLHSTYSDGDFSPAQVVQSAQERNVSGLALTDHNGVGGAHEAAAKARAVGMQYVEGIEISARSGQADAHILGYSRAFDRVILQEGLAATQRGYTERVRAMVERCHEAGYRDVSFSAIEQQRAGRPNSAMATYDVARELVRVYQLAVSEAHRHTIKGGACYVPYGAWAMTPAAAIDVIHRAGGVAVLAHPGILVHEAGETAFQAILRAGVAAGLDGLEVYHPWHGRGEVDRLVNLALERRWLMTGGSDWHGTTRFPASQAQFGQIGINRDGWQALRARLAV